MKKKIELYLKILLYIIKLSLFFCFIFKNKFGSLLDE